MKRSLENCIGIQLWNHWLENLNPYLGNDFLLKVSIQNSTIFINKWILRNITRIAYFTNTKIFYRIPKIIECYLTLFIISFVRK